MTAQPSLFGKDRLAHLLHVPPMFIDRLIDHGLLPEPDGPNINCSDIYSPPCYL